MLKSDFDPESISTMLMDNARTMKSRFDAQRDRETDRQTGREIKRQRHKKTKRE